MADPEDVGRDYPWSLRQKLVAGFLAMVMVPVVLVAGNAPAAAAASPLIVVGTDVVSATLASATYETTIRNEGNGEATDVWVSMTVPEHTTFESSDPQASPKEDGGAATCDNAGIIRESAGTKCEWFAGTFPPGESRTLRVVLNLLPAVANVSLKFEVRGTDPVTGGGLTPTPADTDATLKKTAVIAVTDTFVDRTDDENTNHGTCDVITTRADGSSVGYVDLAAASSPFPTDMDRLFDAEFQMNVLPSDYSAGAPGSAALHPITSGDWAEGSGGCTDGTHGSGNQLRTGYEPTVTTTATSTAPVTGPGPIRWNVTSDMDGSARRAAFQGWQIRNTSSGGSLDLSSLQSTDTTLRPRLFIVYATAEAGRCIDVDPDHTVGHPSAEQKVTAVVMKSGTTNYDREVSGAADACQGTPAAGHSVLWDIQGEPANPDTYISNQAGTTVLKDGTTATDVGPDSIRTTTNSAGTTFVGVSLGSPETTSSGESRIAGCVGTSCPTNPQEPEGCTGVAKELGNCTPGGEGFNGEGDGEDDAYLGWSPTAPSPSPSPSSSPSGWPSPTPTPTPTGSPSSSESPSPSTTPSASPSTSTSPLPSGSPSPTSTASGLSPAVLDLQTSTQESEASSEVILAGALTSDNPTCAQPGTTVQIFRREADSAAEHLAYVGTGVGGTFEHKVAPEANAVYSARVGQHGLCAAAESAEVTVLVRPVITIKSPVTEVKRYRRFWILGTVKPEHQLSPVTLWRKIGPGQFKKMRTGYLDEGSRYSFSVKYRWKRKRSVFIVRWDATDADHISSQSPKLRIKRKLKTT